MKKFLCVLITFILMTISFIGCNSNKKELKNQTGIEQVQQEKFESKVIFEDESIRITYIGKGIDELTNNKTLDIVLENLSDQVLFFDCLEVKVEGTSVNATLAEVLEPKTVVETRILVDKYDKELSDIIGVISVYNLDNSYCKYIDFEVK